MTTFPTLVRTQSPTGEDRYLLGHPVVDRYLEFVAGHWRHAARAGARKGPGLDVLSVPQ